MTLLGFHSLEEGLDLFVICMIADNGNANPACLRNGVRDFTDCPGSCPRLGGRRPPRHVDRRTLLTKQRYNTCADASACTCVTTPTLPAKEGIVFITIARFIEFFSSMLDLLLFLRRPFLAFGSGISAG